MPAKNYTEQAKSSSSNKINTTIHPFQVKGSDVIVLEQATSPSSSPTLNIQNRKKRKKNEDNEMKSETDRLSKLHDDILVYFLSFVDMKTAGRTSVLSTRWRYVWTHITHLDFKDKYSNKTSPVDSLRCGSFCKWVNNVTSVHRAPNLNSMRIHFRLPRMHFVKGMVRGMEFQLYLYVHQWIKFGLRKKVAKLELNLVTAPAHRHPERDLSGSSYMIQPNITHFKINWKSPHLKSLHLEALCIDGPLVEKVLSNCVNLEQLIVKSCAFKSFNLVAAGISSLKLWCNAFRNTKDNSKISVSSAKLKHLEFSECNIEVFHISAPKLTSLVLIPLSTTQTMPEVEYTSVPSLVDVTFVTSYCLHIFHSSNFPSYTLGRLTLRWDESFNIRLGFGNLCEDKIIALISFIEACRLLHTLKLEMNAKRWVSTYGGEEMYVENGIDHEHLKVIEIVGYDGSASTDRIVRCLAHPMHTPNLNKIILGCCSPKFFHNLCDTQLKHIMGRARAQAKLLANQIPEDVRVVIL